MSGFGAIAGQAMPLLRLAAPDGTRHATVTPFGARLVSLWTPDRNGTLADIVLGHDSAQDYLTYPTYFGATCGRYANRIADGRFALDGQAVQLDRNEGANHLHGGGAGFDTKIWAIAGHGPAHVQFAATSADGEMGYPGRVEMTSSYRFTDAGHLQIEMTARTDRLTVINMVNHAYFNLGGHASGNVLGHEMQVAATHYTPVDAALLTTGEIRSVDATAFDFRRMRRLDQDAPAGGFDHNWCLTQPARPDGLIPCAELWHRACGRGLRLSSTEPGVQIYTAGQMTAPIPGKQGVSYGRFAGLTLETQKFPCSPNWRQFPDSRLAPGATYRHLMDFAFLTGD